MVQNSGITKKTKVQFFNSFVLSQLANLYQYAKDTKEESNNSEHKSDKTVRQKVHDLLLKICGSLKLGICFSNTAGAFATRYFLYICSDFEFSYHKFEIPAALQAHFFKKSPFGDQ